MNSRALLKNRQSLSIELEIANLSEATKMIVENHYLKRGRTMAQIAYWIKFNGETAGVILFALPRLSVKSHKFNFWSPMEMIELARLWIKPQFQEITIKSSNQKTHSLPIASMAIARSLKRILSDWKDKYPNLPELKGCVAWSDDVFHSGTIYKASNFKFVGKSGGNFHGNSRRLNGGSDKLNEDYKHPKSAFLYEFSKTT